MNKENNKLVGTYDKFSLYKNNIDKLKEKKET